MAKNTPKENTYKVTEKKVSNPVQLNLKILKDRRFQLAIGLLFLSASIYLTIAFISYIFTGRADQSLIESLGDSTIREAGTEAENWLGLLGAITSYYFMFKWFGLAAFLFIPTLFFYGYKFLFRLELFSIKRWLRFSTFILVWSSVFLGYLILTFDQPTLSFISGGIGYELAAFIQGLLGWGTTLFLVFTLSIFIIYFFDFSTLKSPGKETAETSENDLENEEEEFQLYVKPNTKTKFQESIIFDENEEKIKFVKSDEISEKEKHDTFTPISQEIDLSLTTSTEKLKTNENITLEVEKVAFKEDIAIEVETPPLSLENYDPTLDLSKYQYPPVELLNEASESKVQVTKEELEANKDKIVATLAHYGIGIASIKATIGPTVTLYEIVPEAGIRISKIKNLEDDIALSLAALGIRIIAPIPGKGTIGIEVPNKKRELVNMRSVITSEKFQKYEGDLPIVLGKTISNEVYVTDLAKMPHLLMAGATGQGKSVGLNVILTSLIYKKHPSQLKFILVDPKKVELSLFNKIERHFLAKLPGEEDPIITDTKKVIHTLTALCVEMDNRYNLLKEAGCRNLKEYNQKFVKRQLNPEKGHKFMPYIVLVIDELADLMMTAGKEVEQPIARLAQLARAIGIHLVVATQRPSVNVITGIIKANFPARLSFRVTSKIDSRTILDAGGSEQLVGMGDMLLSLGSDLIRLQCPFLDTPEVEGVCDFIGSQRGYESAYLLPEVETEEGSFEGDEDFQMGDRDSLFEEAARIIVMHQQGSTSLLQRRLKLGYNRAGRLIDQLEHAGVVGPFEGSKARKVLISDEDSLEELLNSLG